MAASVLTLFLSNPIQSGSSAGLLTLTQPATSTSTTGWTVAKNSAGNYSLQTYNIEKSGGWATTAQPAGAPASANGHLAEDCWRTSATTSGNFSAGTWYSSISVVAVTAASSQVGVARFRLWHSANADGSGAVEFTAGTMVGTSSTALSTTVAHSSSASTRIASSTITNEYLFLQVAWQITTAAGSNSADCLIRQGAITSNVAGSFLATSAFSIIVPAAGGAVGPGYYHHHYYRGVVEGQV